MTYVTRAREGGTETRPPVPPCPPSNVPHVPVALDIDRLVEIRIADAARRIAAARQRRAELGAARQAGLTKRHAAKLRRQAQRQAEAPVTGSEPEQVQYLYEIHDPNWDDTFTGWAIRRHRILKKTPRRIFYTDQWGRTFSLDRQRLEADGHIWDRVHQRRLYLNEPEMPDSPALPGLDELKAAMADAHPDRGGTDAEFIAARARYERAARRQADTTEDNAA